MHIHKILILLFILASAVIAGCAQPDGPSVRKARVIAAENMQLRKDLEQRDSEIEKLKELHKKELEEQEKQLAESQKEVQVWKEKSRQNIRAQVKDVLDTVVEENAKLREQIIQLQAGIDTLKAELDKQNESREDEQSEIDYFVEP